MQFNPYGDLVNNMVAKCDLYKKQEKDLLKGLSRNVNNSVKGRIIRKDTTDQYKCVTENWMKENYDDRVKEWWPMKKGILIVKLEDDTGVDCQDPSKSIIQMLCHLGSYILSHSKRLTNNVIWETDGFDSNNNYYGGTDSAYIHEKTLV